MIRTFIRTTLASALLLGSSAVWAQDYSQVPADPVPAVGVQGNVAASANADISWRYKMHNGEWWYWTPSDSWVIWRNNQWMAYDAATYQPPTFDFGPSYYNPNPYRTYYRGGTNYNGYGNVYGNGYYNNGYNYRSYGNPNYGRYGYGYDGPGYGGRGWGNYNYGDRGANVGSNIGGAIGSEFGAGRAGAQIGGAIGRGRR